MACVPRLPAFTFVCLSFSSRRKFYGTLRTILSLVFAILTFVAPYVRHAFVNFDDGILRAVFITLCVYYPLFVVLIANAERTARYFQYMQYRWFPSHPYFCAVLRTSTDMLVMGLMILLGDIVEADILKAFSFIFLTVHIGCTVKIIGIATDLGFTDGLTTLVVTMLVHLTRRHFWLEFLADIASIFLVGRKNILIAGRVMRRRGFGVRPERSAAWTRFAGSWTASAMALWFYGFFAFVLRCFRFHFDDTSVSLSDIPTVFL